MARNLMARRRRQHLFFSVVVAQVCNVLHEQANDLREFAPHFPSLVLNMFLALASLANQGRRLRSSIKLVSQTSARCNPW